MSYLFTSESVSEGHPDKVADQISDALLDQFLAFCPSSKVACETMVTTGQVIVAGEVRTKTYIDVQKIVRDTINKIGYTKSEYQFDGNSCGVLNAIHDQSNDINQGVDRGSLEDQGAGDQGMMFGYATDETQSYMPLALDLSHLLLIELAEIRRENTEITYLRLMLNLKLPLSIMTITSHCVFIPSSSLLSMTSLYVTQKILNWLKNKCAAAFVKILLMSLFHG